MNEGRYPSRTRLRQEFFAPPVEVVARELLGKTLVHRDHAGLIALRLVEVEAYLGEGEDEASHAHRGRTPRNGNMFATPGRLYVYLSYGMHHCLNVVCEPAGRAAAVPRDSLYRRLSKGLGVPRERIVNEYGMTELLSQLYEPVLREGASSTRRHVPPPWLRVRALDPVTLAPVAPGRDGLLAFFDLANLGSVCHVLTEDVGSVTEQGLLLRGRAPGAEPRGCSRAMDELMAASTGVG